MLSWGGRRIQSPYYSYNSQVWLHGINSLDVIACHQDIIHIHTFVRGKWEDRHHNHGPQVDKILEKGIPTFPRLSLINVKSTVEFYDIFQKTSMIYLLPITPLDCISIKMG
jgi:hypothetical protein